MYNATANKMYYAWGYLKSLVKPGLEKTIGSDTVGFSSNDITQIMQSYKKMQTRYKSNEILLKLEKCHLEEVEDAIEQINDVNHGLNDDYVNDWLAMLIARKNTTEKNIAILEDNQELYNNYKDDLPNNIKSKGSEKVSCDDDEFWLCKICMDNRKNKALDCGHVFCENCVTQFRKCPNCKANVDTTKIRSVFL